MKHLRDAVMLFVGLVGLLALTTSASAGLFTMDKTAAGTVFQVEGNSLTIMSKTDEDHSTSLTLQVNDKTAFNKVASVSQLQKGDQVQISYKEEAGQNIALSVTKVEQPQDKLSFNKFIPKLNPEP